MVRLKSYILFFVWIGDFAHGRHDKIKLNRVSMLNSLTVDLVKSCYKNYENILLYYDESGDDIIKYFWTWKPLTILNNYQVKEDSIRYPSFEGIEINNIFKNVDAIFVIVNSTYQLSLKLRRQLYQIGNYRFWYDIPVFITIIAEYCCNMEDTLRAAWRNNYPTSNLLCFESENIPVIFTFNPYVDRAPKSWKKIEHPTVCADNFTLYKRQYYEDDLCEGLNFDRTKYLDGTNVLIRDPNIVTSSREYIKFAMLYKDAIRFALNITYSTGFIGSAFDFKSSNNCIIYSHPQLLFIPRYEVIQFCYTYHIMYSHSYILSFPQGYLSPIQKIYNFYGYLGSMSAFIILIITFFVILMNTKKNKISFAIFEILRLLINTSLSFKIRTLSCRILFAMIFLYFLIMHALFQGNLSKFLTKPAFKKNVDSLKDYYAAEKANQLFFIYKSASNYGSLSNDKIRDLVTIKNKECGEKTCINELFNNTDAALIIEQPIAIRYAVEYNLYLSKNPIVSLRPMHFGHLMYWPLTQRVNNVLMWLEQSGISKQWQATVLKVKMHMYQQIISDRLKNPFGSIKMNQLHFAFIFLIFGLTCAFTSFIIEILIRPLRNFYEKKDLLFRLMYSRKITNTRIF